MHIPEQSYHVCGTISKIWLHLPALETDLVSNMNFGKEAESDKGPKKVPVEIRNSQ